MSGSRRVTQYFSMDSGIKTSDAAFISVNTSVPNRPVRTPGPWRPIVPSAPGGVGKDGGDGVRLV